MLELAAQTRGQRRQTQRQRLCLTAARQVHLQVDEVLVQALLAVIPLGQLDALAQRNVIDIRRRQVQVQLQTATFAQPLFRQCQFVEVFGHPRRIQVFAVIGATVQLNMLGPAEQVLQAEDQQAALAGAFLDPLGLLAHQLLLFGGGQQVAVAVLAQLAGLGFAEVLCRVQPQRQGPGRPLAAGESADAAGFAQRLTQRPLQGRLGRAELARIGA